VGRLESLDLVLAEVPPGDILATLAVYEQRMVVGDAWVLTVLVATTVRLRSYTAAL